MQLSSLTYLSIYPSRLLILIMTRDFLKLDPPFPVFPIHTSSKAKHDRRCLPDNALREGKWELFPPSCWWLHRLMDRSQATIWIMKCFLWKTGNPGNKYLYSYFLHELILVMSEVRKRNICIIQNNVCYLIHLSSYKSKFIQIKLF